MKTLAWVIGSGAFLVLANACSAELAPSSAADHADLSTTRADHHPPESSGAAAIVDASTSTGDARASDPACFDPSYIQSYLPPPSVPVAHQGQCSDGDITQFIAACVRLTDAGLPADTKSCDAFLQANAACGSCIYQSRGPWAAFLPFAPYDVSSDPSRGAPDVAACVAALSSGTDACKSAYANRDLCAHSGCRVCSTSADYDSCVASELEDLASTCNTNNVLDGDCIAAIRGVSASDAASKCGVGSDLTTSAGYEETLTEIAKTLCE